MVLFAVGIGAAMAESAPSDAILGTWATSDGNLVIRVYDAGDTYAARFVYGALVVEADGRTLKTDEKNPDPSLRSRSLADVDFVSELTFDAGDQSWEDGVLYQASTGATASARVTMDGEALNLRAYRGTPLLGRTIVFQRQAD
ncbi:DUF2147 domain-containing protein [Methylobrevis pamukkalensis]|nr:DUF2147 domain-containing protein [Methylobrevis pamukkalensis]